MLLCGLLLLLVVKVMYRPQHPDHPPLIGPNFWTNIACLTNTTTAKAPIHLHELSMSVTGHGKTKYGAVFQMYMTSKNFVVVTDHILGRMIFVGDSAKGIKESEKTTIVRVFDLTPKFGSIFSCLTSDTERHRARKFLAPCFSFSNLKYTFEIVLKSLVKCNLKLAAYAKEGSTFDLNDVMIKLTFDVITESSFGMNWNVQSDEVSDGTMFLHETEIQLREAAQRAFNPFLKYFFWLKGNKRYELAVERIFTVLRKVVSDYRAKQADNQCDDTISDQSIMGHLMRHDYNDEDKRLVDMNAFLVAGGFDQSIFSVGQHLCNFF